METSMGVLQKRGKGKQVIDTWNYTTVEAGMRVSQKTRKSKSMHRIDTRRYTMEELSMEAWRMNVSFGDDRSGFLASTLSSFREIEAQDLWRRPQRLRRPRSPSRCSCRWGR
jgi:predicted FMN-binding regulatory protein PaiB